MEFTRLVGSVLEVAVQPQNQPDPKLVAQLAAAMGNLTVLHKGIVALQLQNQPDPQFLAQLAAARDRLIVVHKGIVAVWPHSQPDPLVAQLVAAVDYVPRCCPQRYSCCRPQNQVEA